MQQTENTKAILVSFVRSSAESYAAERSLSELESLLQTACGETVGMMMQIKDKVHPATVIGKGKVEELATLAKNEEASLVVFDMELSPSQIRNLEEALPDVRVIDRSMLILDIFALHAVTGEGKLQVELAQLQYSAPRLTGQGVELSRLGGTIGTRGPGETKLETDRRHMRRRIYTLTEQLKELEKNRAVMRAARDRSALPKVAIVGYTNAGKSTLLNALTGAGVLSEDKLFATLDPTTRKFFLPDDEEILLTDTVGFIRHLPHHLVRAFRSTLDEAVHADIILILADASEEDCSEKLAVTYQTLEELGANDKPIILVYNKVDRTERPDTLPVIDRERTVFVSAKTGKGLEELLSVLQAVVRENKKTCKLLFPYDAQSELNALYRMATVKEVEYLDNGTQVTGILDAKATAYFANFIREV